MIELGKGFLRDVLFVVAGTTGAQAIGFLFTPFITRLYGPETFGVVGAVMASVAIGVPLFTLGLSMAIVLPKKETEASNIALLSIYSSVFFSIIAFVFFLILNKLKPSIGLQLFGPSPIYVPTLGILASLVLVATQFLVRAQLFKRMAAIALANALLANSIKIAAGILSPSTTTLLNATLAGILIQVGFLYFAIRQQLIGKPILLVDRADLINVLSKYRDFPKFRMPQNILYAVSQGLPVLLLVFFSSPVEAGFFTLARMAVTMPSALVTQSVSSVLYPQIAENAENYMVLKRILLKITAMLFLLGLFPFGLIAVVGPDLFTLIFGSEWYTAGIFAALLTPMMLLHFMNAPAVLVATALRLQHGILIYEIFSTTIKTLALFIGLSVLDNPILSIGMFSAAGVLAYIGLILWVFIHVYRKAVTRRSFNRTDGD